MGLGGFSRMVNLGGQDGAVWAESSHRVNRVGGEIFAKTAKTPPLQSGVGGDINARCGTTNAPPQVP